MLIGYAQVSTIDQDLALQMDALRKAGCKRTFTDKMSSTRADRCGMAAARKRERVEGQKRRMTPGKVESDRQLLAGVMPRGDVAWNFGVSTPTLYH